MTKQFTPGSIVRVKINDQYVLMGVGQASLRGLLDQAEDINDILQEEVVEAQTGTTSADLTPLTPAQKRAATIAAKKAAAAAEGEALTAAPETPEAPEDLS